MSTFSIHTLGCGSAKPSVRHNPSCTVLDIRGTLYMIDCGEGAQQMMQRMRLKFNRLRHIFITHLHGDHFLGLPGLLSTLSLSQCNGTVTVHTFKQGIDLLTTIMDTICKERNYTLEFQEIKPAEAVVLDNNAITVKTIPLRHRVPTVGFIVEEKPKPRHIIREMIDYHNVPFSQISNIKAGAPFVKADGTVIPNHYLTNAPTHSIKYAHISDTSYMPEIVDAVRGSDLLLHESTYLESEAADAVSRGHSTARQAAALARDANAGKLLLTHYSSRYHDEQRFLDEAMPIFPHTILNKEGLVVNLD